MKYNFTFILGGNNLCFLVKAQVQNFDTVKFKLYYDSLYALMEVVKIDHLNDQI